MSDTITVTGAVKVIEETQTFNSGFSKRQFVVTTEDKYPQDIVMEVVKDKCGDLDNLSVGQSVTAHINIRGNEYNGRYYVDLQAWRIESNGSTVQQTPQQAHAKADAESSLDDKDDIPF